MSKKIKIKLAFLNALVGEIGPMAFAIIEGLTKNSTKLPNLPVSPADLETLRADYENKRGIASDGTRAQRAEARAAKVKLLNALALDASYVGIVGNNNEAFILSCGYQVQSTNRSQSPLQQVEILAVTTPFAGALKPRLKSQRNVKAFEGRIKLAGADQYGPVMTFAGSRAVLFGDLEAGQRYTFQLRAVGGSTGTSDWSDERTHMAL